ncbi:pyridine nucleotide-disulfide oxidoreductase [Paenibacillus taihuensis]|uniref:Pyridine nucleotide-disulfide oxidoreductase n=1 Tax=Paenibacillus taihuensis TaxID=1156355 RepID=A0A3D9RWW1_9BACL|nr:NAD(P)-binding domain-containing protein [Paenibacillus taihuensis]REE81566.1 pyridine nucleotide-disulfide oxidoreductase [Paenibacillus taihuensis]
MSKCCGASIPVELPVKLTKVSLNDQEKLPVAIIGGGPVGLAAAAHLVTKGESFILFEAAAQVAGNMKSWSHVRVFSPWQYNIDKAARQLLEASGWSSPDKDGLPTGGQIIEEYLAPLAELPEIKPNIRFNTTVTSVSRKGISKIKTANREKMPFVLHVLENGENKVYEAKAVIDASGTWSSPNPAVSEGVWTDSELAIRNKVTYGIPDITGKDRDRYAGKSVLVVGSGHSAINALLDLAKLKEQEPQTTLYWVIRKSNVNEVYGGQGNDGLPARGALGTRLKKLVDSGDVTVYSSFLIEKFGLSDEKIVVIGQSNGEFIQIDSIDEVISNTGSRPDLGFLREVRTDIDSAIESVRELAPLIDPNFHSCGTVRPHGERELRQPDPNFYIVGSKSYGRAPTFLMATGYEQVRSIVAALTGDCEAAEKVELELPETGVCSTTYFGKQNVNVINDDAGRSCCGPAPDAKTSSSCCG